MISINGVEISDALVDIEQNRHAKSSDPRKAAIEALVLREVLLQTARRKLAEDTSGELQAVSANSEIDTDTGNYYDYWYRYISISFTS